MKILVLSLLRLGDALLAAEPIAAIRARYPSARVDLLVNKGVESVAPLLPDIGRVFTVPRELLQDGLVRADRPIFEPLDRLKSLVARLSSEKYDKVINLTQTKFSGYLAAAVEANEKIGMVINHRGQASFGSPWFRYLNSVIGAGAERGFHYVDIFKFGSIGHIEAGSSIGAVANETEAGKRELDEWLRHHSFGSGAKILLQLFTSDKKKNWSMTAWIQAIESFRRSGRAAAGSQLIALGAPNERPMLEQFQKLAAEAKIGIEIATLSLQGVLSLMRVSDVLVTGDTSIKHLAALTSIRIVEIALGSSDIERTGAYKDGALIISSRESCVPCRHSAPCHRDHHACAQRLDSQAVGLAIAKYVEKDWASIHLLAHEYKEDMKFTRATIDPGGCWLPIALDADSVEQQVAYYLDLASWRFLLNRQHEEALGAYGTESVRLKNWMETSGSFVESKIIPNLDRWANSTRETERRLDRLLKEMNRRMSTQMEFVDDGMSKELTQLESQMKLGTFLSESLKLSPELGLYRVRRLHDSLNDALVHQRIKLKLLRTFRQTIRELS